MTHSHARHIIAAVAALAFIVPPVTLAQTGTMVPTAPLSETANPVPTANQLAERYSTALGSRDDALTVIDAMRAGKDVTLGSQTVTGTGNTMGYGTINMALALAGAQAGTTASTQDFLASLDQVMDMRAAGTGWGQIARELGLQLGQVVSASVAAPRAAATASKGRQAQGGGLSITGSTKGGAKDGTSGTPGRSGDALASAAGNSGGNGNGNSGGNGGGNGGNGNGGGGGGGGGNGGGRP